LAILVFSVTIMLSFDTDPPIPALRKSSYKLGNSYIIRYVLSSFSSNLLTTSINLLILVSAI
jgi:hypothetical protein